MKSNEYIINIEDYQIILEGGKILKPIKYSKQREFAIVMNKINNGYV